MHLFHWCNMDWQSKVHRRVYLICVLDTCCTATKHPSETPVGGTYHQLMNSMTLQTLYSTIIPFHPSPLYRQCSYGSVLDNCALSSLHRITAWEFTTVRKILRYNTKSTCTHRTSLLKAPGLLVAHVHIGLLYYRRQAYLLHMYAWDLIVAQYSRFFPSITTKHCPSPKYLYTERYTCNLVSDRRRFLKVEVLANVFTWRDFFILCILFFSTLSHRIQLLINLPIGCE